MPNAAIVSDTLQECALEPIHIPGSIQPHGYLFVLNKADLTVAATSENAAEAMGIQPQEVIGRPISDLLVSTTAESLEVGLKAEMGGPSLRIRFRCQAQSAEWDGIRHETGGVVILELTPWMSTDRADALIGQVRDAIERIQGSRSPDSACKALAQEIRRLTGYDRVMVYRFDADWNGEVIAESKSADAHSFNGHYFPAGDIPAQARALYTRNTIRLIPDAAYTPSPVIPAILPSTGLPIDLTLATLRSVSPIHLEYLANMGVAASMSVSVVRDDRLWGLVACHHLSPRRLSKQVLQCCQLLAQAAAWYLDADDRIAAAECSGAVRRLDADVAARADGVQGHTAGLVPVAPALLHLTNSQGMAICDGNAIWTFGVVPSNDQILSLVGWLPTVGTETLSVNCLSDVFPPANDYRAVASGAAARRLPSGWLVWFREEWPHIQTWAGQPGHAAQDGLGQGRINPRKSFASWQETIVGQSRPWTTRDLVAIDEIQLLILQAISRDQMRRVAESERALRIYHDRIAGELKTAARLQANLLPAPSLQKEILDYSGLDIAGRIVSRSEVGGDFWGLADLGDGTAGVYIVDFAGHGVSAALNTFRLYTLIQESKHLFNDPTALLKCINIHLCNHLQPGEFATAFYCIVDSLANCITYAAAGCPPPIIRCGRGLPLRSLDSSGIPLGITAGAEYPCSEVPFGSGAMLFLYSDVFTESIDERGERAGEASVFRSLEGCAQAPAAENVIGCVCAPFLDTPTDVLHDDLTAVCIMRA